MNNPHDVLGLDASASPEEIKATYQKLVRKFLDEAQSDDVALARVADRRLNELNAAYAVLTRKHTANPAVLNVNPTSAPAAATDSSASPPPLSSAGSRPVSPPPVVPRPLALFDPARSHYIPREAAARSLLQQAFNSDSAKTQSIEKQAARIARSQIKRNPSRWLPSGTYSGSELQSKVDALLTYAIERQRGRAIGDKLTLIGFGLFVIMMFAFDPEANAGGEDISYTIGFSTAAGLILSLLWVYLPLKILRWGSRHVFGSELGGSVRSWILQTVVAGALMFLITVGIVLEGNGLPNVMPGRGPNTTASPTVPARPTQLPIPVAVTVTQRTASGAPSVVEFRNTSGQAIEIAYTRQNQARLYKGSGTFQFRPNQTLTLRDFDSGDLVVLEKDGYKTLRVSLR